MQSPSQTSKTKGSNIKYFAAISFFFFFKCFGLASYYQVIPRCVSSSHLAFTSISDRITVLLNVKNMRRLIRVTVCSITYLIVSGVAKDGMKIFAVLRSMTDL